MASMAAMPATIGAAIAGIRTLVMSASPWTAPVPAEAMVAPIRPPMRACEELEGRPTSQVSRFQRIAPTRAAKMTSGRMPVSSTRPLEIVLATSTERKAPTRFSTADMATATLGLSAPVEMVVAIALAVS